MAEIGGLLYCLYVFGNMIMSYYSKWASKSLLSRLMVRFQPMGEDGKEKKDLQKKKQNFVGKYGVTPKDPKRLNLTENVIKDFNEV